MLVLACMTFIGPDAASAARTPPIAQTSRTINLNQSVDLHLVRKSGSTLYEEGTATGTLPGKVTARFNVNVLAVTGTVTFYPRGGGSITCDVRGAARSISVNAKFGGTMIVRSGTGRFAGARGGATFEGRVNRRSWDATVNATGHLRY
jgi:hypothetical protein